MIITYASGPASHGLKSAFFSGVLVLFPSQSNLERCWPLFGEPKPSFHFAKQGLQFVVSLDKVFYVLLMTLQVINLPLCSLGCLLHWQPN